MDEMTLSAAESRANARELPEGYEDEAAFLAEARERFQEGVDADHDNQEAALDDLKFVTGEGQWDSKVEAARRKKGRPVLRINDLPQFIGQVIGDIRTNRPSIKVSPVEDADEEMAEVRAGLIRSIENLSNATQVYSLAGEDQVTCGLGHFRVVLKYVDDDSFDQDIRIEHIANPFAVVWDAFHVDATGSDARFAFIADEVDRKSFKRLYPHATTSELTTTPDGGGWSSKDSMRVSEYWLMQQIPRTIALVQRAPETEPKVEDITGREDEAAPFIVTGSDGQPRVREALRREAWMYLITGTEVLDGPYKYPISRLPIFKVTGREIRFPTRRYRFGLIRFAKDPMRMKNVWRSAAAEWLALSPKQQWMAQVSDAAGADLLRKAIKGDDTVIPYTGATPPTRLDPPTAPSALLQEAQMAQQDMKDVTGLHDASLGMRSNETSGKAIVARERQGDVATFMYHDNLNLSIKECGKVVNELIPGTFDNARTIRLLGVDERSKIMRVNDPAADGGLFDITKGKYDIVVETGPSYSTKRAEQADSMATAIQSMPIIGQVAADLFVDSQGWTGGDLIVKRLRKAMPQELTAEDGDEPTPEQVQAAQAKQQQDAQAAEMAQQAQQMDMRKAELELAEQEAKTRQAIANAAKAEADARKAEFEAMPPPPPPQLFGPGGSPPLDTPQLGDGFPAAI